MRMLIALATENEVLPQFRKSHGEFYTVDVCNNIKTDILITGPGAVPTAFALTRYSGNYDFIFNAGIAGSFTPELPIGSVVLVESDAFADYGVDDNGTFIHLDSLPFASPKGIKLGTMACPYLENIDVGLPRVRGVTVSFASGSADRISFLRNRWSAQLETMESAAVFYVCLSLGVPFVCLRAISNIVEPRNRHKWQIDLAVERLWEEIARTIPNLR